MSEVKRYVCFYDTFMEAESQEDVNGEWVKYEDYARLHSLFANSEQENARLKSEVERLRKAGDVLESGLRTLPGDFPRCLANEWTAAKEGKQS